MTPYERQLIQAQAALQALRDRQKLLVPPVEWILSDEDVDFLRSLPLPISPK